MFRSQSHFFSGLSRCQYPDNFGPRHSKKWRTKKTASRREEEWQKPKKGPLRYRASEPAECTTFATICRSNHCSSSAVRGFIPRSSTKIYFAASGIDNKIVLNSFPYSSRGLPTCTVTRSLTSTAASTRSRQRNYSHQRSTRSILSARGEEGTISSLHPSTPSISCYRRKARALWSTSSSGASRSSSSTKTLPSSCRKTCTISG